MDQPLYTLVKEIQWNWPELYGEDKLIVMFGPLHIEMGALRLLGEWLDQSGWTSTLVQANISSVGIAISYVKASHVGRTRRAHQITACALFILLKVAYKHYMENIEPNEQSLNKDDWCNLRCAESPQFHFWYITLKLQMLVLTFVSSVRWGDFQLYINSLTEMMPWFFAMNHVNYARWLSIHIRDMASLDNRHPDIFREFTSGKFVVHKTTRPFSAIGIDHAHEQANALVKGDGGAIGLTEDPTALRRWMLAGPEVSRIIKDFENQMDPKDNEVDLHHEQTKATQDIFAQNVRSLSTTMEDMGNPYMEESKDLLVLDSRDIVDPSVTQTIQQIGAIGKEQYDAYVQDRLIDRTVPIHEPIKKNKLCLFRCPNKKAMSKDKLQLRSLKSDCSLFSRLFISCQVRGGDLDFF